MQRFVLVLIVITSLKASGWIKVYHTDTEHGWAQGYSVRQTTDGGYVIVGSKNELYADDSVPVDLWLIKTDSAGDTMWTRTYGRGGDYLDEGLCVQQTTDGGYIITGYTRGTINYSAGDLWLLKTDEYGDTQWTRTFMGDHSYDVDKGYWVEQTSDGGYIVTGYMDRAFMWLIKTDEDGDTTWTKTYHGWWGRCVREINGGYIVSGGTSLLKTNDSGDSLWLKSCACRVGEVKKTTNGAYILIGGVNIEGGTELRLVKADSIGDTLWTRTYGGPQEDGGSSVDQTTDGGFIVLGNTKSFGTGHWDVWLLKTDSSGDTLWTRIFGEDYIDEGYSVQQTTDGGYIISGSGSFSTWRKGVLLIKTDSLGYAGVEEAITPLPASDWEVVSTVGSHITLRYTDRPKGFSATIYDASGRKIDEIGSSSQSAILTWGEGYSPGVYFIKDQTTSSTARVVIIR